MPSAELRTAIKEMMVEELMLRVTAAEIGDDTPVFGPDGLGLDSVDALQLSVGLDRHFGLKTTEGEEARRIFSSVNSIAEAIEALRAGG
jgi:acyl carrier protein